jgi:hypothetical protein
MEMKLSEVNDTTNFEHIGNPLKIDPKAILYAKFRNQSIPNYKTYKKVNREFDKVRRIMWHAFDKLIANFIEYSFTVRQNETL